MFNSPNSYIGVDIGTFGIKVVELVKKDGKIKLLTYGFSELSNFSNNDWQKDVKYVADKINKICLEAGVENRNAISALPTFSVFSSIINLPKVAKNELVDAINWEAKKVIPIPLDEMTVDWRKIDDDSVKGDNMKVLLTGAPNSLVKKYMDIFAEAQIGLVSLEPESFSLIRALLGGDKTPVLLVEIGASTTDITIIENNIPIFNRSIDIGGMTITAAVSKHLGVGLERAEQFKYDLGISSIESQQNSVPKIIADSLAPMINEMKYTINLYANKNDKKVDKIVLSGGSSLLPGLVQYLSSILNINVYIGDPWSRVDCPEDLKPLLNQIGPRMSVAVGLAMRGL